MREMMLRCDVTDDRELCATASADGNESDLCAAVDGCDDDREYDDRRVGLGRDEDKPGQCAGCKDTITDRYYLVAVDKQWHAACLVCAVCKLPLDSQATCFAKDGRIYCKEDYCRYIYIYIYIYLFLFLTTPGIGL